ncbi:MAG: thiamine pyrophosphate-dependent enzyme [Candidatus Magasanikbacteria bacterium]
MSYNILNEQDWGKLKNTEPDRFSCEIKGGSYLRLQGLDLAPIEGIDTTKLNEAARIMRGFMFASLEASHSGHPGGSSAKTEQFLGMVLGGAMAFDVLDPKNPGRDRLVWSAGHCTPLLYAGLSLIYESLRKKGIAFDKEKLKAVLPEDLTKFRHHDGPQGHVESYNPLTDVSTGPSGHGMPSAGGMAIVHKSCGLDTRVFVFMGDAESEEGMTYEARNILNTVGADNMIVSLDYNHYGIDGDIAEVLSSPYINHWIGLGWNVIEIDGHNVLECVYAYHKAKKGFGNGNPTVILAHGIKGKYYGAKANTADSHGSPAKHDEYVSIMKELGFDIPGVEGDVQADIDVVVSQLTQELAEYIVERLDVVKKGIKPEQELVETMKRALPGRTFVNPLTIRRPDVLPKELVFEEGTKVATRKATQAFFEWMMKQTAFFWAGTGDLSKSILTQKAEDVFGDISRTNPLGRGIRFGIAEQNMAMMSCAMTADRLPGGFAPVSVFSTYAVFTSMMTNAVRLVLIGNHLNPKSKGFFIMLAAHDGPETGEDGPTHQGLYWMSMFNAYPGIKVYKPMDANETVEMLFYALEKGEPIALSVARPDTMVFKRENGIPPAREAVNGAYVFYETKNKEQGTRNKKTDIVLVVSGGQTLLNTLEAVPQLEAEGLTVKIVAVTSPELFEELRKTNPGKANSIFSDEDRSRAIALHNGWKGFLYPFLLPADYEARSISIDTYLKSGTVKEVYELAGLTGRDILEKVKKAVGSRVRVEV